MPDKMEFTADDYRETANKIRSRLNEADLHAVLSNRINIILGALTAAPVAIDAEHWRQKFFEARDALYQFNYPPDPKVLREIAEEIDCGTDCDHGHTEWDTNAHVCSKSDMGECAGEKAWCLRQFADAIDARPTPVSSAAAGKSREDVRSQTIEECAKVADKESEYYRERAKEHDDIMANEHWAIAAKAAQIASRIRSLPPPSVEEGGDFHKAAAQSLFEAKNHWADRARKAEAELTALRKEGEGAVPVAWLISGDEWRTTATVDPEARDAAIRFNQKVEPLYAHPPAVPVGWRDIAEAIVADYMTSEQHHPGYVLIPAAQFERLRAMLESHPSPAVVGEGWRDISTAPKDGTEVQLFYPHYREGGFVTAGYFYRGTEHYLPHWYADLVNSCASDPTHWQPLSASPSIDKEGA